MCFKLQLTSYCQCPIAKESHVTKPQVKWKGIRPLSTSVPCFFFSSLLSYELSPAVYLSDSLDWTDTWGGSFCLNSAPPFLNLQSPNSPFRSEHCQEMSLSLYIHANPVFHSTIVQGYQMLFFPKVYSKVIHIFQNILIWKNHCYVCLYFSPSCLAH